MLLYKLSDYYNLDNEDRRLVKIGMWMTERIDDYADYFSDYKLHFWWNNLKLYFWWTTLVISTVIFLALPQIFCFSYYWVSSLRYSYRLETTYEEDQMFTNYREDIEKWSIENEIDFMPFFIFREDSVLLFPFDFLNRLEESIRDDVGFKNEEDAMAFKLMWT